MKHRSPKQYHKPKREWRKKMKIRFCRNCMRLKVKDGWKTITPRNLMSLIHNKNNDVIPMLCENCARLEKLRELKEAKINCGACGE